jgi:ParB-like chromosome segregation protein Spo0J
MHHLEASPIRPVGDESIHRPASVAANNNMPRRERRSVPILSLRPGDSPRLEGESAAHVAWLAETEARLPPILVERRSMRVIDGMHRLLAASAKGVETIEVEFFDGNQADAFLLAVEANVKHGLLLTQADRRSAASRIISSHPHMSDRAIGESVGLAAKTVAGIRRRSTDAVPQLNARVGRDGRVRPLNGVAGRRRAAELLAEEPRASLRAVARAAGVSPATASDVRRRLERGEEPTLVQPGAGKGGGDSPAPAKAARPEAPGVRIMSSALLLEKLLRDPSLRHKERGRWLLRLLQHNAVKEQDWSGIVAAVPPHSAALVVQLARQYAQMWQAFAQELDERVRVISPRPSCRANGHGPG